MRHGFLPMAHEVALTLTLTISLTLTLTLTLVLTLTATLGGRRYVRAAAEVASKAVLFEKT